MQPQGSKLYFWCTGPLSSAFRFSLDKMQVVLASCWSNSNKTYNKRKNLALLTLRCSQKHYEIFSNNVFRKKLSGNS